MIYITPTKARDAGLTNHGKYFGLPIWCAIEGEGVKMSAKLPWLNWLIPVIMEIEALLRFVHNDPHQGYAQVMVGPSIEGETS